LANDSEIQIVHNGLKHNLEPTHRLVELDDKKNHNQQKLHFNVIIYLLISTIYA
jgi:hypothetical protein